MTSDLYVQLPCQFSMVTAASSSSSSFGIKHVEKAGECSDPVNKRRCLRTSVREQDLILTQFTNQTSYPLIPEQWNTCRLPQSRTEQTHSSCSQAQSSMQQDLGWLSLSNPVSQIRCSLVVGGIKERKIGRWMWSKYSIWNSQKVNKILY